MEVVLKCKVCNSKNISEHSNIDTIDHEGQKLQVNIDYSVCNDCEREFVSSKQIKVNELRIRDAKKVNN